MSNILLKDTTQKILDQLMDTYLGTQEALGSETFYDNSKAPYLFNPTQNLMDYLTHHKESGRSFSPKHKTTKFYINALLGMGSLKEYEAHLLKKGEKVNPSLVYAQAKEIVFNLINSMGFIKAPSLNLPLKHIDFIALKDQQVLMTFVRMDESIENRILEIPPTIPLYILEYIMQYFNRIAKGHTLEEFKEWVTTSLNPITPEFILSLPSYKKDLLTPGSLSNFKEHLISVMETAMQGESVEIYIGAQHPLFKEVNCLSYPEDKYGPLMGSLGVMGPQKVNHGKIIPRINYTNRIIQHILESGV